MERHIANAAPSAADFATRVGAVLFPVSVYGGFAAAGHPVLGAIPAALVACAELAWHRRQTRLEDPPDGAPHVSETPARAFEPPASLAPKASAPHTAHAASVIERWRGDCERSALALRHQLERHDPITGSHLARLPRYTRILAEHVAEHPRDRRALTADILEVLPQASTLHDVGKLGVSPQLLRKRGRLTADEFAEMKRHTTRGGRALRDLGLLDPSNLLLRVGQQIAMYHHERWDGSGYPFGLRGLQIPLVARVVAVADVYDALTSVRPYKPAYGHEASCRYIVSQSGTHFDPVVVESFLRCEILFAAVCAETTVHEVCTSAVS